MSNELKWSKEVATILKEAANDFSQEVEKLDYKWRVQRAAASIMALPEQYRQQELNALDFWFGLDVHLALTGSFDGVPMAKKSIEEERRRGWSTD